MTTIPTSLLGFIDIVVRPFTLEWSVILTVKVGLDTHLFVKVLRPRDSEVIFSVFQSSCHLLPSV